MWADIRAIDASPKIDGGPNSISIGSIGCEQRWVDEQGRCLSETITTKSLPGACFGKGGRIKLRHGCCITYKGKPITPIPLLSFSSEFWVCHEVRIHDPGIVFPFAALIRGMFVTKHVKIKHRMFVHGSSFGAGGT